jgi:hypothetical protein
MQTAANPPQLTFQEVISYPSNRRGITLHVALTSGDITREVIAKLDPGAGVSLFSREIGEQLELDIESGVPLKLESLYFGGIECFGHEVTLRVGSISTAVTVYFAKHYDLPRNFLGLQDWMLRMKVGIVHYESKVYLGPYDES